MHRSCLRQESNRNSAISSIWGIFALVIITALIAASTYYYVNEVRWEMGNTQNIQTEAESYGVDGEDLSVVFSFTNISNTLSGHFEAESNKIKIENRSAVGYVPVAVDIVDVVLGDGDITREVVFDGLVKEDSSYCVEVIFVTKTSVYRYQDIIVFGGD